MKDFHTIVYPDILKELSKRSKYVTKTDFKPNHIKIENEIVYVKTEKSSPNYEEIPVEMFKKTWELLTNLKRITQNELSKRQNIKRSAFMLIAFELLDYVKYNTYDNSINLKL